MSIQESPESPLSPENRRNVQEMHQAAFQADVGAGLLELEHDRYNRPNPAWSSGLVLYNTIDRYFHRLLHRAFMYQDITDFDIAWYMEANEFVANLDSVSKCILKQYTHYGDEIVNSYLRYPDTFAQSEEMQRLFRELILDSRPLGFVQYLRDLAQREPNVPDITTIITRHGSLNVSAETTALVRKYRDAIADPDMRLTLVRGFIRDLTDILERAPRLRIPTRVFRGIRHDYLRNSVGNFFQVEGFLSTTANPYLMTRFGTRNVHEIILDAGIPCIPMESVSVFATEMELLVAPGMWALPDEKMPKVLLQQGENDGGFPSQMILFPAETERYEFHCRHVFLSAGPELPRPQNGGAKTRRSPKTRKSKSKSLKVEGRRSLSKEAMFQPSDPVYVKATAPPAVQKRLEAMKDAYTKPPRDVSDSSKGSNQK
jgi:hypothetical protein